MDHGQGDYYSQLGQVADLMSRSVKYGQYPTACLAFWVAPAIRHQQIYFFLNENGQVCGYATWAWLAEDAAQRLAHDPDILLHFSEWNEGDQLWIVDLLLLSGDLRARLGEMFALFPGIDTAQSLRRRDEGTVRKITLWRR